MMKLMSRLKPIVPGRADGRDHPVRVGMHRPRGDVPHSRDCSSDTPRRADRIASASGVLKRTGFLKSGIGGAGFSVALSCAARSRAPRISSLCFRPSGKGEAGGGILRQNHATTVCDAVQRHSEPSPSRGRSPR